MTSGKSKQPIIAVCRHCGDEFVKTTNAQKFCRLCGPKLRAKAHMRAHVKWYRKYRAIGRARREALRRQNLENMYRGMEIDDFFTAVRGPAERGDRRVHIKCAGIPSVFLCGKSHRYRRRWMLPVPVRDVTCPVCMSVWKQLFGDAPVPVVGHEVWSEDTQLKKEYGFG